MKNMMKKPFKFWLCTAIFTGLVANTASAQQPPKPKVRVEPVTLTQMAPTLTVPGNVISKNDTRLAAEISATVEWVAEVGTSVNKGDIVARMNSQLLKLDLINNKADIKRIQAQLTFRTKELKRLSKLLTSKSIPQTRYDEAISRQTVLEQELTQAHARRDRTAYLIDKSNIKAPVSGWIVERFISIGEHVSTGEEIVRLVDVKNTEIRAQAPLSVLPNIGKGTLILVSNKDEKIWTSVRAIIPVGDNISRMVEIRVDIPADTWMIGAAVRLALPKTKIRSVMTIPRDALIIRADESYVYKVAQNGKTEKVDVKTGVRDTGLIEVSGDLSPGDQIVIRGGETLKSGQDVDIIEEMAGP